MTYYTPTPENIRGGNDGNPLDLIGDFTGFNNGPTMQVGLWISNDSQYAKAARHYALTYGPVRLAQRLSQVMGNAWHNLPGAAAASTYDVVLDDLDKVDWCQVAYDLIGGDPEDEDVLAATEALAQQYGSEHLFTDREVTVRAFDIRAERARKLAMRGVA